MCVSNAVHVSQKNNNRSLELLLFLLSASKRTVYRVFVNAMTITTFVTFFFCFIGHIRVLLFSLPMNFVFNPNNNKKLRQSTSLYFPKFLKKKYPQYKQQKLYIQCKFAHICQCSSWMLYDSENFGWYMTTKWK